MTVAKKRRKRLFDAALPLNYPRKASRDRSHSKLCDVNKRLVGAPSCYCNWYSRASSSQENQCNIMVPGLTEDDVHRDLQKHTAKTLNESNVAIVLLNLSKD